MSMQNCGSSATKVSVEFNMVYRLHSTTSDCDEAWLNKFIRQIFGDQSNMRAFGVYNIPRALKVIEMLGIQQGREWGLASLNEFRAFFKLQLYSSFGGRRMLQLTHLDYMLSGDTAANTHQRLLVKECL
ncbi:heme peroxidase [Parachaetomium inaequale]|uniref:Heme peroxidase n=1 Tax=Parachaetomium inaequale TaxID=2588326 RepID=A0AAN6PCH8_9PEZI|nr:heme peroxidase [Parachaetomium inaequale]